jgi:hypothetical protein
MTITLDKAFEKFDNVILSAIKSGIELKAKDIFEEKKQEMIKELDEQKDEIVAGISLKLMKYMRIDTLGNNIRIEVLTDTIKNKVGIK